MTRPCETMAAGTGLPRRYGRLRRSEPPPRRRARRRARSALGWRKSRGSSPQIRRRSGSSGRSEAPGTLPRRVPAATGVADHEGGRFAPSARRCCTAARSPWPRCGSARGLPRYRARRASTARPGRSAGSRAKRGGRIQVAHQTGTPVRNMRPRASTSPTRTAPTAMYSRPVRRHHRVLVRGVAAAGDELTWSRGAAGEEQADGDAQPERRVGAERRRSEERRRVGHVARGNDDVDDEQHALERDRRDQEQGQLLERLTRKARRHQGTSGPTSSPARRALPKACPRRC